MVQWQATTACGGHWWSWVIEGEFLGFLDEV